MPVIRNDDHEPMPDPPAGSKILSEDELKNFMKRAEEVITPKETPKQKQPAKEAKNPAEEVPKAVRKEYVRSLLAGERFSQTYSLFGGTIKATFQSRTVEENEMIHRQSIASARNKHAMELSLKSLYVDDKDYDIEFDSMDTVQFSALLAAFRKFERVCDQLYLMSADENFWQGIGGRA